jgi:plasmid replication initiation protein
MPNTGDVELVLQMDWKPMQTKLGRSQVLEDALLLKNLLKNFSQVAVEQSSQIRIQYLISLFLMETQWTVRDPSGNGKRRMKQQRLNNTKGCHGNVAGLHL